MATLLLLVIYSAYIGLGVPDSLFGTAWPAIYREMSLPISYASAVTMLTTSGTITSSLFAGAVIRRLGTGMVTALSTSLTALALLGYSFAGDYLWLCLLAIPLGLGAGAIDVAQNNYVALHYNATHMNFLHCFYGVGVTVSPYLMAIGLRAGAWRSGYRLAFLVQSAISLLAIVSIPLWRRAHPPSEEAAETAGAKESGGIGSLLKEKAAWATFLMFMFSCAIESICTNWGSTYLVNNRALTPADAANIVALYFAGVAIGRFLSGVFAKKLSAWNLITIGLSTLGLAILLLLLPIRSAAVGAIALLLTGLGIAPIYPNLTYLTPIHFGRERSATMISAQMALTYVGILLAPLTFGLLAGFLGSGIFSVFLLVLYAVLLFGACLLVRSVKKRGGC